MIGLARTTALGCTLLLGSLAAPALAQSPAPAAMAPVDCSTAGAQMTAMMQMPGGAAMPAAPAGKMAGDTGSVDKMFASNMAMMMQHGHMMAAIEMQCGKDPATRARAKEIFDDTAKYTQEGMQQSHPL